ncbi:hypothetical protein [Xanthocytophaga agilis]|uniref:Uncharacterized protein n=1 Tax=Xanthocytophaga agilis TaxID=3048010 RepID=A0AAE3R456_9BACT|nr:hypothetical protein [Xanthocytophaga agilis]MDJ1503546.1 hypothetical protein [Xanthocytophaga agilis]
MSTFIHGLKLILKPSLIFFFLIIPGYSYFLKAERAKSTVLTINTSETSNDGDELIIRVNKGFQQFYFQVLIYRRRAVVEIGGPSSGLMLVNITDEDEGQWQTSFNLTGSGIAEIFLFGRGSGIIAKQWPSVECIVGLDTTSKEFINPGKKSQNFLRNLNQNGKPQALEIYLNNLEYTEGPTKQILPIKPDTDIKIKWKKDSSVVCETIINLPYNAEKICECDVLTRKVKIYDVQH